MKPLINPHPTAQNNNHALTPSCIANCQFAALMQRLMHVRTGLSSYPRPTIIAPSSHSSGIERTDHRASVLAGGRT
ncbi:hypothetical protein N7516_003809 [Penicillium verrucosum]|uniref:uncharacterized protein n=1 Tax=Penicillium verrucosum TaxID=60171 RepID=UPI0025459B23|nr:uncharacterized protein N7516_003809 [Penicillium verrucosum]KAJ5943641.1 hypothetical protein N7516_003809 [Penicillium verrucosum]